MTFAAGIAAAIAIIGHQLAPPHHHHHHHHHRHHRVSIVVWAHRRHPCLAKIVDLEDSVWDPTISFGGGHGDTSIAYGLPQADPGTKLAYYPYTIPRLHEWRGEPTGSTWRTNPWVQMRWMVNYAIGRYSSECGAYYHRITYRTY